MSLSIPAFVEMLHELQASLPNDRLATIRVHADDDRLSWTELGSCDTRQLPALPVGQDRDCRWSLTNGAGLHAHHHRALRVYDFHLDWPDPIQKPGEHVLDATYLAEGAGVGGIIGAVVGGLVAGEEGALLGLLIGGGSGALAGTLTPRRRQYVVSLDQAMGRTNISPTWGLAPG